MADIFETKTLVAAVEQIPPARTFLKDTFFPGEQTHDSRIIEVDVVKGGRSTAPYVSPVREGVVMKKDGARVDTIKLPYIKAKYDISAAEAAKRQPGENPYNARTPAQRAQEILGKRLAEGKKAIARTVEVQAALALTTGKVTLTGKDDSEVDWSAEVDFGRDAGLIITLGAGEYWSEVAINPLDDLRDWALMALKTGGYAPTEVVMGSDALAAFLNNPNIQKMLDTRRMAVNDSISLSMAQYTGQGVTYVGTVGGFNIYHYVEWYENASGVLTEMVPAKGVIMGAKGTRNTVHYGAIVDLETSSSAIERSVFPKSWTQQDPSVRWLMLQSSPLATLHEPDSTVFATVLA